MKIDIDDALRTYVSHPPPQGMETRILRRIKRPQWHWPALGLVAAGLSFLVLFRPSPAARDTRLSAASVVEPYVTTTRPVSALRHRKPKRNPPKPNPIDALYRFAQEHPEDAIQLAIEYEPLPVAPLKFDPIVIDELEIEQ